LFGLERRDGCAGALGALGRRRLTFLAAFSACVLVAGLLGGCSTTDTYTTAMIDPAHYSVYHCDGLVTRLKGLQARELELSNLMARAGDGGAGLLIGNLSYRADYENAVAEEKVLRRTAADKNCDLTAPPPAPAAPTAATFIPPQPGRRGNTAVIQSTQGAQQGTQGTH
jgi:hypothetical protein